VGDAPAAPGVGVTKYPDDETYPGLLVLRFDADRTLLTAFSRRRQSHRPRQRIIPSGGCAATPPRRS
jgi:hypothetical protein